MTHPICSVDGCNTRRKARGMCNAHYTAAWRNGTLPPAARESFADPEDAFEARTERDAASGCLLWTGAKEHNGYGRMGVRGKLMRSHRYAWERKHGPIPDGMIVDHTCYTPDCVEVAHLRLATVAENGQNRAGAQAGSATGIRNVYRRRGGYQASVRKDDRQHRSVTFSTVEEATRAAEKLRAELFGEFAGRG